MTFSDQLAKLSARAKQAETRAAAAQSKARSDLEADLATARASSRAHRLREGVEPTQGMVSHRRAAVRNTWTEYIAAVHETIDEANEELSLAQAQRAAASAEDDASYAIGYAYAAIEEAECSVLHAEFARMKADELEAAARAAA